MNVSAVAFALTLSFGLLFSVLPCRLSLSLRSCPSGSSDAFGEEILPANGHSMYDLPMSKSLGMIGVLVRFQSFSELLFCLSSASPVDADILRKVRESSDYKRGVKFRGRVCKSEHVVR